MSVDIHCDGCGTYIDGLGNVYCEDCVNHESDHQAEPEDQMGRCNCGAYVPKRTMVEKVEGLKCRKCAHKYEQDLLKQAVKA